MAEVTVRRATADDVDGIVALGAVVVPATYAALSPEYAAWCQERWWSPHQVATSLDDLTHWVAERDGEVVGVANLGELDGEPIMWKLYVHPDHHRHGIGAALLARVEEAAGSSLTLERLGGNERAAAFYEAQGFVETHRTVADAFPDLTWVWMRKDLS